MSSIGRSLETSGLNHRVVRAVSALGMMAAVVGALSLSAVPVSAVHPKHLAMSASADAAYTSTQPSRLLDTRSTGATLGPGGSTNLTVAGGSSAAPSGATAVVLNVTVTNTTAPSFLTVYPTGQSRPLASNLNWVAGKTVPNLVEVPVGTGGQVTIFNSAGSTDVVVDEEGFFAAASTSAGGQVALTPARITDTRPAGGTLGAASTLNVQVTGQGGVPASGAAAAILNVTVTNTTASGFLTVWPTGAAFPLASNLNWVAGQTVPNRVIVPVGTGGKVSIFNSAGSTDVVVDVSGYFTDATASGQPFTPQSPIRLADTRGSGSTLGPGGSFTLQVGGLNGVPSSATAVILNTTVTNTTAPSFLTAYPTGAARPLASDLNWVVGQTVPNLVVAKLGSAGSVTFFNSAGSTDVVVDLFGFFGGAVAGVTVKTNPSSIPADGTSTSTVTATVTRADGTFGANDPVNFSLNGAACGTVAPNPVTTGVGGQATTTYTQPATPTVGSCTITATEANAGLSGSATVTQTAVPNTVTGPSPAPKVPADGASQVTVTFTVKNGVSGAFAVGDSVTFATSGGAACGVLSGSTSPTSATGQVSVTYTATTTVGFCTITATDTTAGGSGTSQVTQTSNPPPGVPNAVAVTANPTHAPADGTSTSTVAATVTKGGGGAAINDPVQFSSNCGTFSPILVNTNASGVATSTYTTSTTAGACTITATEAQSGTATNIAFTQDVVANKIAATANPSSIPADGLSTSTVTATVTAGVGGAPVSMEPVLFTQGAAPCSSPLASATVMTNASGQATFTYTSSIATGFCNITVKDNGAMASGGGASTTVSIRQF